PPIAEMVRRLTGPGRFYHAPDPAALDLHAPSNDVKWLAHWKLEELTGYSATTWGIPVTLHADYDGLAPQRIVHLTSLLESVAWPRRIRVLQAAGVTSFMTTAQLKLPDVELVSVLRTMESHPIGLYRLRGTKMARFVSTAYSFPTEKDALKPLFGGLPYDAIALTDAAGGNNRCGTADVQVTDDPTYIVDAPCKGWVALAENDYPGWKTTVDGQPQQTVRADYAFVAVPVSKGHHVIRRRYVPMRPIGGLVGSLLATVALLMSHWFSGRPGR
ncbi:MAG: YfhO family protein, partial [Thermoanaerobaculia bacterium]